jgi:hypothetical protein
MPPGMSGFMEVAYINRKTGHKLRNVRAETCTATDVTRNPPGGIRLKPGPVISIPCRMAVERDRAMHDHDGLASLWAELRRRWQDQMAAPADPYRRADSGLPAMPLPVMSEPPGPIPPPVQAWLR